MNALEHPDKSSLAHQADEDGRKGDEGSSDGDHHVRPDDVQRVERRRDERTDAGTDGKVAKDGRL